MAWILTQHVVHCGAAPVCEAGGRCGVLGHRAIEDVLLCELAEVHKPRGAVAHVRIKGLPRQLDAPHSRGVCPRARIEVTTSELPMRCRGGCDNTSDGVARSILLNPTPAQRVHWRHVHIVYHCLLAIRELKMRKLRILISLAPQHWQGMPN